MTGTEENEKKRTAREKQQISSLRSASTASILGTLSEIRSTGRVSILPEIFELLKNSVDDRVLDASRRLLNDLKSKDSVPVIVEAIRKEEYRDIRKDLVASC